MDRNGSKAIIAVIIVCLLLASGLALSTNMSGSEDDNNNTFLGNNSNTGTVDDGETEPQDDTGSTDGQDTSTPSDGQDEDGSQEGPGTGSDDTSIGDVTNGTVTEGDDQEGNATGEEEEPEVIITPESNPTERTWTTLFYVAYDSDIGEWGSWDCDLHYLEQVGAPEGGHLVALVDQEIDGDCEIVEIHKGGSIRYPVSKINPGWGNELDTGDPDVLADFIIWGMQEYPATCYDLHLMDHGGAWQGICGDFSSETMLWAWDINYAFEKATITVGRKIDIVSMDACLMGSFEFGYEISEYADYMTATETFGTGAQTDGDEYYPGNWLYDVIWGGLVADPHMKPCEFAMHHMNGFNPMGPFLSPSWLIVHPQYADVFVVANLTNFVGIKDALDVMAQELLDAVTSGNSELAKRQMILGVIGHTEEPPELNTESFSGSMDFVGLTVFTLYDVGDLTSRLIKNGSLLCSPETAAYVNELYSEAILACVHGDNYHMGEHPDATGLTLHLPYRDRDNYNEYKGTLFAKDTMWDEFLDALCEE